MAVERVIEKEEEEMIIEDVIIGIGNFANTLISIITGSLPPAAVEGLTFLFLLGIVIRVINVGPKIPGKIAERIRKREDDEDEWEYIRVRRRR